MSEKEDFIADVAKECVHDAISALTTERDTLRDMVKFAIKCQGSRICTNVNAAEGCDRRDRNCLSPECHDRLFEKIAHFIHQATPTEEQE